MVFDFYPRPPRGGRLSIMGSGQGAKKFLSTPSARRATSQRLLPLCPALYFYPRPPRGGRRYTVINEMEVFLYFYPRPPRGGRHLPGVLPDKDKKFLSTPSARRATTARRAPRDGYFISIHALREEGDFPWYSHHLLC